MNVAQMLVIEAVLDEEAGVWVADIPGGRLEADSPEALSAKVEAAIVDLMADG